MIDEGLDGRVVLRGQLPQSSPVAVRGSAAADTRVRHQDRTMRHIVLEELFELGHAHQRQSACLGEYRPKALDFSVLRVPRQRRPLHEAERHPESHRTRANVVRQPLPPCKHQQKIRAFLLPRDGRKLDEAYLGRCTDNFPRRRLLRAALARVLRALGLRRKIPNPGDGETADNRRRSKRRCMLREKSSDINLHTGFTKGWRYC